MENSRQGKEPPFSISSEDRTRQPNQDDSLHSEEPLQSPYTRTQEHNGFEASQRSRLHMLNAPIHAQLNANIAADAVNAIQNRISQVPSTTYQGHFHSSMVYDPVTVQEILHRERALMANRSLNQQRSHQEMLHLREQAVMASQALTQQRPHQVDPALFFQQQNLSETNFQVSLNMNNPQLWVSNLGSMQSGLSPINVASLNSRNLPFQQQQPFLPQSTTGLSPNAFPDQSLFLDMQRQLRQQQILNYAQQQQLIQSDSYRALLGGAVTAQTTSAPCRQLGPTAPESVAQTQQASDNSSSTSIAAAYPKSDIDSSAESASSLHSSSKSTKTTATKSRRKSSAKKPHDPDRPKRPLSAYNIFFQDKRALMLGKQGLDERKPGGVMESGRNAEHDDDDYDDDGEEEEEEDEEEMPRHPVGFAQMARTISKMWKTIDPHTKSLYQKRAAADKERYEAELKVYHKKQQDEMGKSQAKLLAMVDEETKRRYFQGDTPP